MNVEHVRLNINVVLFFSSHNHAFYLFVEKQGR